MLFAKYLVAAIAVAMPTLGLATPSKRSVGHAELAGRSYLIVKFDGVEEPTVESRGVAGDKLVAADGTTYLLVPENGVARRSEIEERSYLIVKFDGVEEPTVESRGVAGDKLVTADGTTYNLVAEAQ